MYADDHQLFSVAKSSNEAERILTREGNNNNKLKFIPRSFYKNIQLRLTINITLKIK